MTSNNVKREPKKCVYEYATIENPSFELNAALLSRAQVFVLNRLYDAALGTSLILKNWRDKGL